MFNRIREKTLWKELQATEPLDRRKSGFMRKNKTQDMKLAILCLYDFLVQSFNLRGSSKMVPLRIL